MTTTDIIKRFELQVDDSSELSSSEELDLANEVYDDIQNDRAWEWLNAEFSGVTSTIVNYVDLPVDFRNIIVNSDGESFVYIGTDYSKYKVIPFSKKREFKDKDGFCYIDIPNKRLVFTKQPIEILNVEFDYTAIASALLFVSSPLFRDGFHKIISYGMAAKFNPIELTDKTVSYQKENQIEYFKMLSDMRLEDINIKLSLS